MAYNPTIEHGNADYRSWAQIPSAAFTDQGEDGIALENRKYAKLVQIANTGANVFYGQYAQYIVDNSGVDGNVYVCKAAVGSSILSAVWQASKINVTGTVTTITWADGNTNFDNIANNAATLTYS